jgi:hypothetical protein
MICFVLFLVLAINGLHSPALAHDHDDHHVASMASHAEVFAEHATDQHPASDEDRTVNLLHDHQPPAGLNVSDFDVDPETDPARNLLNPAVVAILTSRVADPPTEPPTA